jgi:L-asparaginase II
MRDQPLIEIIRGDHLESVHRGQAVLCNDAGEVVAAWGDPDAVIYPRSAAKMLQALPLVTSGAADAARLTPAHLALACASHSGEAAHVTRVGAWLKELELAEADLRCGTHPPTSDAAHHDMIREGRSPCQLHNNCSGKHAGFLTLAQHLKTGPDYIDVDHPVQRAVRQAIEDTTGTETQGWAVDGCSAPNFRADLRGFARAMAWFATAQTRNDRASQAAERIRSAMMAHPDLVAGTGRACTQLMHACAGKAAVKTGAEAVFFAMLPEQGLGLALKISDGSTRASECAVASILKALGALPPDNPAADFANMPIRNCRGLVTGHIRATPAFARDLKSLAARIA